MAVAWAVVVTVQASTLIATPTAAQEGREGPRVAVSGSFGYMAGGPAGGLEEMLEAAGFGDLLTGGCRIDGCTVDQDYPRTASDPGPASNVRVSYSQWARWELAISFGSASPSETSGYSQVLVPDFGRYTDLESKVRMLAVTAGPRLGPVTVGVGPARYALESQATRQNEPVDEFSVSKMGGLLDAGAQFELFKKAILELRFQYRFVGATDTGPLQLSSRTLPVTSVDFSHAYFGFGVGLAFK